MTPKEKARYLFNLFGYQIGKKLKNGGYRFNVDMARLCALKSVDEIINSHLLSEKDIFNKHPVDYWQEVKQEIEKL